MAAGAARFDAQLRMAKLKAIWPTDGDFPLACGTWRGRGDANQRRCRAAQQLRSDHRRRGCAAAICL